MKKIDVKKKNSSNWFRELRDDICLSLEEIEKKTFQYLFKIQ